MADISKIKPLGSNTTYNIKDNSAIASITRSGTTFTATRRDGTTFTFNQDKYVHPTTTAIAAAAVKVGKDSTGHVVIGSALTKSDVGLSNVENTKLSTWTGTNNITTLGAITTGTWNGNTIDIAHGGTGAATAAGAWSNIVAPGGIITGNLQVNGNTSFTNETSIDSATIGNIIINGNASFIQSPTAPTPANNDSSNKLATTEFVYNTLSVADAMIFKGVVNSANDLPVTHNAGWTYKVATAGAYAGVVCEVGDLIVCIQDGTTNTNSHWHIIQTNIDGAVTGPASATTNHIATFNGNTGKIIQDSGYTIATSVPANAVFTDTKNTAGSTSTNDKIYIIGAKEQSANPQTYSADSTVYISNKNIYANNFIGTAKQSQGLIGITSITNRSGLYFFKGSVTNNDPNSTDYTKWSCPNHIANTTVGTNSLILRLLWGNNYFKDIYMSPNSNKILYREVSENSGNPIAGQWRYIVQSSTDGAGDINTPIYITNSGNATAITGALANDITGNAATATKAYSTYTYPTTKSYIEYQQDQATGSGNINLRHHNALAVSSNMDTSSTNTKWTELQIGNTIASGTVGNSQGRIALYGSGSNYTQITTSGIGNNNYFYIPNYSGNGYAVTHSADTALGSTTQPIYLQANGRAAAVSWYPKYCTIDGQNTANYPWHRFATCTTGTNQYTDRDAIIVIYSRCKGGSYGIIKVSVRTNSMNASIGIEARWIFRQGFSVGDVRIAKTGNTTGIDTRIDVYVKCTTYPRRYAYLLEGPNNGFNLINSNEVQNTTVDDKKTSVEVYEDVTTSVGYTAYNAVYSAIDFGTVNHSNVTTGANLTTTANAIAYYTDTTGTFGQKASANGALYATGTNGALQWGTLPISQGGTGNSTFNVNTLIYSETNSKLSSSGHYANSTKIAVNSTSEPSYNFYVNGTSYFNGNVIHNGFIYFANGTNYYIDNNATANLKRGVFAGTSTGETSVENYYQTGAIEIRESNRVRTSQTGTAYAPRIGFHWGNHSAASLYYDYDGKFYLRKTNGVDKAILNANLEGNADTATKATQDANGNNIINTYLTKTAGVTNITWDNTNKKLIKTINNSNSDIVTLYAANLKLNNTAVYNTELEIKNIKIGNGSTSTSTKNVKLEYNETLETLNFVFS